jgi:hypothetical protein
MGNQTHNNSNIDENGEMSRAEKGKERNNMHRSGYNTVHAPVLGLSPGR